MDLTSTTYLPLPLSLLIVSSTQTCQELHVIMYVRMCVCYKTI